MLARSIAHCFAPLRRIAAVGVLAAFAATAAGAQEVTLWTHWAAEKIKREFVEEAIRNFEAANPGVKIKASWYEKTALYAALKTALRAGQAPDIFYAEPDQVEYMENGLLLDLSGLNWNNIEPWAKQIWSYKGKPYGFPLEAWTVEVYYNTKMMQELGQAIPANRQLDAAAFLDHDEEGEGQGLDADVARRGRPAVSRRAPDARGAAREARHRRLRQAAARRALVERSARRRHAALRRDRWSTPACCRRPSPA